MLPVLSRVSQEQRDELLQFMVGHPELAKNRINGPQGAASKQRLWVELAGVLNSCSTGVSKPPERWAKVWQDWRSATKKKAGKIKAHAKGTGGGPPLRATSLSAQEEEIMKLMGRDAVDGHEEVADPLKAQKILDKRTMQPLTTISFPISPTDPLLNLMSTPSSPVTCLSPCPSPTPSLTSSPTLIPSSNHKNLEQPPSIQPMTNHSNYKRKRPFIKRSQDSDSENEGGQGNVTRVVMRPPGHSGKAKRGHLCFDASFETGNLGRVDLISEYEYDLFIRPDTCNPRFRLWFNFIVDNIRTDQRVIFNIVNFSKNRNLYREGMTPIVKSTSRPKWQRMPNKHVYYYRSPEHQNHYVLSFAFGFDREEDVYQFAFSYPYSYSRCQAHLEQLERRQMSYFKRELLGHSVQQRRLDLVTITHPQNMKAGKRRRVVFILSRIHPGESPTSYVCQGLIDFLVSSHPIALALRQYVVFKIVPMMNPDGVFLGNYRSSLMGFDLNRTWTQVSQWAHPTLSAVHSLIMQMDNDADTDLDFVLDIHAHSNLQGVFIYGNTYDDVYRYERHIVFPKILSHNAEDYNPANTMYNRDGLKSGTTRRYFCDTLKDSVNCYTLEVSFFGYQRPNSPGVMHYTEESYYRLGRNVARTYLDYYKFVGMVPTSLPASLSQSADRRSRPRTRHHTRSGRSAPSRAQAVLSLRQLTSSHRSSSSGGGSSEDVAGSADSSPRAPRRRGMGQLTLRFPPTRSSQFDSANESSTKKCVVPCRQIAPPEPEPKALLRGIAGVKSLAGRKVGGGGVMCRPGIGAGPANASTSHTHRPAKQPTAPSLTIIDFNQLARGGLEVAAGRSGKAKVRCRETMSSKRTKSFSP